MRGCDELARDFVEFLNYLLDMFFFLLATLALLARADDADDAAAPSLPLCGQYQLRCTDDINLIESCVSIKKKKRKSTSTSKTIYIILGLLFTFHRDCDVCLTAPL